MRLQLDTVGKTITLESNVQLSELVKHLEKLLPKDSPFGHWKEFTLQTNNVITNWYNPIYVQPYYQPTITPYWWQAPYTVQCGIGGSLTSTSADFTTTSVNACGSASSNGIFNLEVAN